jgi:hypothetical protein
MNAAIHDGGTAHPTLDYEYDDNGNRIYSTAGGMSMRDYFAANASEHDIAAHRAGPTTERVVTNSDGMRRIVTGPAVRTREQAKFAYANAMLAAREAA